MGNKTDSGPYINTITNSEWALNLFKLPLLLRFIGKCHLIFVYVIGSIIGIYCCAIHSIAWRYKNDWIRL